MDSSSARTAVTLSEPLLLGEDKWASTEAQHVGDSDCSTHTPQTISRNVSQQSLGDPVTSTDAMTSPASGSCKRSWSNRSFGPMETGSQRSSVLALASTAFGSGMLALPWVFASLGVIIGTVSLLLSAVATYLSLRLLANAALATGCHDYASVVKAVVGPRAAAFLDVSVGVYAFGTVLGNLVFFEDFGRLLAAQLGLPVWFHEPQHILLVVFFMPLVPLSLTRTLSSLRYVMLASLFSLVLVCSIIIAGSPTRFSELLDIDADAVNLSGAPPALLEGYWWLWPQIDSWQLIPRMASMLFFAFCCHISFYATYCELGSPTPQRVGKVLTRAVILQASIFLLVGVSGALSFGPPCAQSGLSAAYCTPTNVLAATRFTGTSSVVARVAMSLAILVVVPLNIHAARSIISRRLLGRDSDGSLIESSRSFHAVVTIALLAGTSVMAAICTNISDILGVVGGGCATTFMFLIPSIVTAALRFDLGVGKIHQDAFAAREAKGLVVGSWLGITKPGVLAAAALLLPCIFTGYLDASIVLSGMMPN